MKYLLDTANLEDIRRCLDIFPIAGVTSNPTIIKREGRIEFFPHMREIRSIIGPDRPLHIQVTTTAPEDMLREADAILTKIDSKVYIKVPATMEGLRAIKLMRQRDIQVTATAVYSKQQGFLAMEAGAGCIAPYFNRMENMGINSEDVITSLAAMISAYNYKTQILAASFKNAGQVDRAFLAGAQAATVDPSILESALVQPYIISAVDSFTSDWESMFGGKTIDKL